MRGPLIASWIGLLVIALLAAWPAVSEERRGPDNILETMQQQALPDLMRSLTDKKDAKRFRILRIVGEPQDARAARYLMDAYAASSNEGVRCKLLESMGRLHDPAYFGWLAKHLNDPHVAIQCFAIWALGELKSPQAAPLLRRKLWDPDRTIQMTAIDALGKTGKDRVIAAELGTFLRNDDVQVRYLAAKALMGVAGEDSAPELAQRLTEEPSLDVQEALARTLGHVGGSVGVGRLIELLKYSPSQVTQYYAELGLKAADRGMLVTALKPLVESGDFRLKVSASRILNEHDKDHPEP